MDIKQCVKDAFSVIGKVELGNSQNGVEWIKELWKDANTNFDQVFMLAKKDDSGRPVGFWGAMSDETMSFLPWRDLTRGYYLAGVEVNEDAVPPKNWIKWHIPSFKYVCVKIENDYESVIQTVLYKYLPIHGLKLCGAIQEFNNPIENGQLYLYFPIERLS
ncbi:MAG: GyrI-like domain-containing protein [Candidatus Izemoplasmatales bacterium]|jgi:predicted transcriptional regulator YdeE|nr:GyrI-like domain-containing protein [Candidatus Izemoplasmatales bacterium]